MKRIVVIVFLLLVACAPAISASPTESPTLTETPFVLSNLMATPNVPTPTRIIISPTPMRDARISYIVVSGDTLYGISIKTGVSMDNLVKLNGLTNPDWIWAGESLLLIPREEVAEMAYAADGKNILVNLTTQMVYAIDSGKNVREFLVSTGISAFPTRVGVFKIWIKLTEDHMVGPGYDLPNVQWVMYFDQWRGFHGKYWNKIYGRPSSHGCVNMTNSDAEWLYGWAEVGTKVWVIP